MGILSKIKSCLNSKIIFSYLLFFVCMLLDFYITDYNIQDSVNMNMEGNLLGILWWKLSGMHYYLDIPIWSAYVFFITIFFKWWKVTSKYNFIPLWWLNGLAFGHLLGFFSWLPYGLLDFIYNNIHKDILTTLTITSLGIFLGLILTIVQSNFGRTNKLKVFTKPNIT